MTETSYLGQMTSYPMLHMKRVECVDDHFSKQNKQGFGSVCVCEWSSSGVAMRAALLLVVCMLWGVAEGRHSIMRRKRPAVMADTQSEIVSEIQDRRQHVREEEAQLPFSLPPKEEGMLCTCVCNNP